MPCTKYKPVVEFLQERDVELCSEVNEIANDVAYLNYIFFRKLNSRNPGIRGNGTTVIMTNSKIKSLIAKL